MVCLSKCPNCDTPTFNGKKCLVCSDPKFLELQAELEKHRWIPVTERLPNSEDRNEHRKRIDDGTIDVFGYDDGIVFVTNYFPKTKVWNGLTPALWKPVILPKQGKEK